MAVHAVRCCGGGIEEGALPAVILIILEVAVSRWWMHRYKLTLRSTVGEVGAPGLFGLACGIRVWDTEIDLILY